MKVIGQAHVMLHRKGIVRIQSDIRVGTRCENYGWSWRLDAFWREVSYTDRASRTDKKQKFSDKVTAVNDILAADVES